MKSMKLHFFFALFIAFAALPGAATAGTTLIINGAMDGKIYSGNTVTVLDTATSDGTPEIHGLPTDGNPSDSFTGNTLTLNGSAPIRTVENFETSRSAIPVRRA